MNIPTGASGVRPQMPVPLQRPPVLASPTPPASIHDTIAATRARIEAKLNSQGITSSGSSIRPLSVNAPAPPKQPTELHPALRADFKALGNKAVRPAIPRVSSVKANQRKEEPRQLKIEHEVPASFTDPAKNPYLDPSIGRHLKVEPRQRKRGKRLQFARPGRFIEQADKMRAEAKVEQLKAEIREKAAKARLDDIILDSNAIRPSEPPTIEWWDAPFLSEASYGTDSSSYKLDGPDSLISIYIQHPVPIPPPESITSTETAPSKVILTERERKRIRRQRRMEQQREHRDKVMLGLLPPDQPKLTMSNFMRIMANQSVPDPTKLEAEVRKQIQARVEKHQAQNKANKLSKEQRAKKAEEKVAAEENKGIVSVAFRIDKLKHPQHRYKVSVNARQMHLTGAAIVSPEMSVVVVEGADKFVRAYKKLMLRRIDWTDSQSHLDDPENSDSGDNERADDNDQKLQDEDTSTLDLSNNHCYLVWQGQVEQRRFKGFAMRNCPTDRQAKNWLAGAGCDSIWQLAKQFNPDDVLPPSDIII
ncbi:U4/U5/U6 small nuclear ribonucleoprotein prp3 [Coemansia sp. RSA 2607]|nr:U4/U5/U6 small nuclear ribonucleoprotein prp3 [Coemansia sp. RSA 2607]